MHVALLGGSFNPPHVGHLMAALYVHATMDVDEVWLMPSFRHPFGKVLESFEHRVHMCEALSKEFSGWLKVSAVEKDVPGDGRTVDTLAHLLPLHPGVRFSLIIGSDIVRDLPLWKKIDDIRRMANLIVLHRAGYPATEARGPALPEVSSTGIRQLLEQGQLPTELVPRAVLEYAQSQGLYGLTKSRNRF